MIESANDDTLMQVHQYCSELFLLCFDARPGLIDRLVNRRSRLPMAREKLITQQSDIVAAAC